MTRKRAIQKRPKRTPLCPTCGSTSVIPVIHGVITPSLQRSIDTGKAIRADREEWEGIPQWHCKDCGCDWSRGWQRFKKPGGVNATGSN
jgi:hypothetical protein